jgi:hypothetical protein
LRPSHLSVPGAQHNGRKYHATTFQTERSADGGAGRDGTGRDRNAASAAEFCRQDAISGMRSCSYATIEQCQAMSSGVGGTCYRDPFLPQAGASNAYA